MLEFKSSNHLTLGVEIELQLIDPQDYDLTSKVMHILPLVPESHKERIKPEIFQTMIELNTGICDNVQKVEKDLKETNQILFSICEPLNIGISGTATHPFSLYSEHKIFPAERYSTLIDRNKWIAERLAIFGLHIHIGMKDGDSCIKYNNFFMYFLPHLLGLSTSSPFWQGHNTGLASSRATVFESSPTAGHPCRVNNWQEFTDLYDTLIKCKAINTMKDIWWDIRPSPGFGTLEIRVCDGLSTLDELLAIVAFTHALAHWYNDNDNEFMQTISPPMWLIRENKWRVTRHGLNADLVADIEGNNISLREHVLSWIDRLNPYIKSLGYSKYIDTLVEVLQKGNSSIRQRKTFKDTGSLIEVVKYNCKEYKLGNPIW